MGRSFKKNRFPDVSLGNDLWEAASFWKDLWKAASLRNVFIKAHVVFLTIALFLFSGCGAGSVANSELPATGDSIADPAVNDPDTQAPAAEENRTTIETLIHSNAYAGSLTVHFDESLRTRLGRDGKFISAEGRDTELASINSILATYPEARVSRTSEVLPEEIEKSREHLERLSGEKLADWNSVYHIEIANKESVVNLYRQLKEIQIITDVYPSVFMVPSSVPTPSLVSYQEYLQNESGYGGLGIQTAWKHNGKDVLGDNTYTFVSEAGLNFVHEDLQLSTTEYENGGNLQNWPTCTPGFPFELPYEDCVSAMTHGTAMAGILVAKHNNFGVSGISPNTHFVHVAIWSFKDTGMKDLTDNLGDNDIEPGSIWVIEGVAPTQLDCEEILTLECQKGDLPAEVQKFAFDSIQQATSYGVTVIEPAGNGQVNLDDENAYGAWKDGVQYIKTLDSGAILVGASEGKNEKKIFFSDCGNRVNSFAWGKDVVTTGYPHPLHKWVGSPSPVENTDPNKYYVNNSGGTSAAAAMVAGVAALVQSHAREELGYKRYLMPLKMREIIVNSGVPQKDSSGCNIGKQPRADVALQLVDQFIAQAVAQYPELTSGGQLTFEEMKALRTQGIGIVCKKSDPANSDPMCPDEEVFPTGTKIAKDYDFDGDGRADLVQWTNGTWKLDLSSKGAGGDNFGAWDIVINYPAINGKWVWPYVQDMNSDSREDFVVYDKEHGKFYIAYTDTNLIKNGVWHGWDLIIDYSAEWKDDLKMDPWQSNYSRPALADYDGDGWADIGIACSDGYWRIDYGGSNETDFGTFQNKPGKDGFDDPTTYLGKVKYLSDAQLADAPGWAYPILTVQRIQTSNSELAYKIPDGLKNTGKVSIIVAHLNSIENFQLSTLFEGNDKVILAGFINDSYVNFSLKEPFEKWRVSKHDWWSGDWKPFEDTQPASIYGGLECRPVLADFDGDGMDDRTVMCPDEWRIAYSSPDKFIQQRNADSSRVIPLGYDTSKFSLPGRSYSGGITYYKAQQLIEQFQMMYPNIPPPILVDMVTFQ